MRRLYLTRVANCIKAAFAMRFFTIKCYTNQILNKYRLNNPPLLLMNNIQPL